MKNKLTMTLAALLIGMVNPVFAEEATEEVVKGAVLGLKPVSRILSIRNSEDRQRVEIYIPEGATITHGGRPASLKRFKRGDLATIRYIRRAGRNEAVVARVPDPTVVVDLPPVAATEPMAEPVMASALPKTASNDYVSLYIGIGLLLLAALTWAVRRVRYTH